MAAAKHPVTYRISAPEPTASGDVGGCYFVKGVYEGPVEDGPMAYFTGAGYTIEEVKPGARRSSSADKADDDAIDKAYAQGVADAEARHDAVAQSVAEADPAAAEAYAKALDAVTEAKADEDAKAADAAKKTGGK